MESYYFKHHRTLNMSAAQLRTARTLGSIFVRPLTNLLDSTGLYLPVQRKMQGRFAMNDLTRNAFGDYQPTQHDVIVATYPKSGTYWMIQIAHHPWLVMLPAESNFNRRVGFRVL